MENQLERIKSKLIERLRENSDSRPVLKLLKKEMKSDRIVTGDER